MSDTQTAAAHTLPPTFIINLASATERRARMQAHLDSLQFPQVEFFTAVLGRALPPEELVRNYDPVRGRRSAGRAFTVGEIGCSLSHAGTCRLIADRQLPWALVLEDDALIHPDLIALLPKIYAWLDVATPRVLLASPMRSFRAQPEHAMSDTINRVVPQRAWNAHGYFVNAAAARCIADANTPVFLMADDWMGYARHTALEVRGLDPWCIGTNDLAQQSQLEADRAPARKNKELSGLERVVWTLRKWKERLHETLWVKPVYGLRRHHAQNRDV